MNEKRTSPAALLLVLVVMAALLFGAVSMAAPPPAPVPPAATPTAAVATSSTPPSVAPSAPEQLPALRTADEFVQLLEASGGSCNEAEPANVNTSSRACRLPWDEQHQLDFLLLAAIPGGQLSAVSIEASGPDAAAAAADSFPSLALSLLSPNDRIEGLDYINANLNEVAAGQLSSGVLLTLNGGGQTTDELDPTLRVLRISQLLHDESGSSVPVASGSATPAADAAP